MRGLHAWYTTTLERLYLRAIQSTPPLPGTDPDDGGHMEVKWGWNDPVKNNRPLFILIMRHTKRPVKLRMLLSPKQVDLLAGYVRDALTDQERKFGYPHWIKPGEAPDWDTRYMRVLDES